jgi:hypothetical protein
VERLQLLLNFDMDSSRLIMTTPVRRWYRVKRGILRKVNNLAVTALRLGPSVKLRLWMNAICWMPAGEALL